MDDNEARKEINEAMDYHRTEAIDINKRIITLIFTAHAGAIVALPTFLKEIHPFGLVISVALFMLGLFLSLKAFLLLKRMIDYQICFLAAIKKGTHDKATEFGETAINKEKRATRHIEFSLYLFILGFIVTVITLLYPYYTEFVATLERVICL